MKHVPKSVDPDGTLFDPQVRSAMALFTDNPVPFEAAAAVRTAAHAVERMRSRGTDTRGVSSGALDILIRLSAAPDGVSIGDLAKSGGVSSRNVTGLVDTLERDGLARRVPDPNDRRSVLATITPAGQEWLDAFRQPAQRAMGALFRGFSAADLTSLRHLCLRLAENQRLIEEHLNS